MALSEVGCISEASYTASFAGGILYRRAAVLSFNATLLLKEVLLNKQANFTDLRRI
jgi:hypothetical protein